MAKMFYTTDEAAQKLGISGDQLKQLITENKLREFRDGARVMFKVDQVDKLAGDRKGGTAGGTRAGTGGPLSMADSTAAGTPADSHGTDAISLADTGIASLAKDDTVVTGEAQKVFKPGEVKTPADTGAQTQIQSAIDDQLSLEGVGSGSGLLDLTRESDDTSLGAELLDEIYPGGSAAGSKGGDSKGESGIGSASGIFESTAGAQAGDTSGPSGLENLSAPVSAPVLVPDIEVNDPSSGAFGGLAFATVLTSIATAIIAITFFQGLTPGWVQSITQSTTNVLIFGGALAIVAVVFAFLGLFMGKPAR